MDKELYIPFPERGNTKIAVEYYNHYNQIANCANGRYPMHSHLHFEMVFILSGTVKHTYKNITTKLIPGDIFVIPPHVPHGYEFGDELEMYNIQFFGDIFSFKDYLRRLGSFDFVSCSSDFSPLLTSQLSDPRLKVGDAASITTEQGVLHLSSSQRQRIHAIILSMFREQENNYICSDISLQNYLEILIVELYRIVRTQSSELEEVSYNKRTMILKILDEISDNLDAQIDFNEIAKKENISPNYFRSIFKTYVGVSPVEYLNRPRVLRALEYLRLTDLPITDVAAQVGIYDASYFTRLFKKYLGHPPKYFKDMD